MLRENLEEEAILMKDVPGWKVRIYRKLVVRRTLLTPPTTTHCSVVKDTLYIKERGNNSRIVFDSHCVRRHCAGR